MKCSKCGAPLEPGMRFCPRCGQPVKTEPKVKPHTQKQRTVPKPAKRRPAAGRIKVTLVIVVLILIAGGVGAAALLFQNHQYESAIDVGNRNMDQKAYTAAQTSFREAVKMNSRRVEGYEGLAAAALAKGQTETADKYLAQAKSREDTNYGKALRAKSAAAQNKDSDAKTLLTQVAIAANIDRRTAIAGGQAAQKIGELSLGEKIVNHGIKAASDKNDLKRLYRELIDLYISEGRSNSTVSKLIDKAAQATGDADMLKLKKTLLVSRPSFASDPGSYDIGFKLTVKAGRKTDTLYYTTDGKAPTKKSTLYTKAIELPPGTTTIRVVAYNASGRKGTVLNGVYTVSALPAPKAQDWQDTKIQDMDGISFSWNAVDNADGYEVEITKTKDDDTEAVRPANWNDQTTSVAVYVNDSGCTVKGKVRAYIKIGGKRYYSDWSNEVSRDL